MEGTIIRLIGEKGFGFIKSEVDKLEYFFHRSGFNGHWDDLVIDINSKIIRVTFDSVSNQKGPRAENVTRIDSGLDI